MVTTRHKTTFATKEGNTSKFECSYFQFKFSEKYLDPPKFSLKTLKCSSESSSLFLSDFCCSVACGSDSIQPAHAMQVRVEVGF